MSGYRDCACCGGVFVSSVERLCGDCIAAGCDATGFAGCQIPDCECGVRASLMSDGKWHANCDATCPNAGASWAVSP